MIILVSNAGSTSLKFKLYRMPEETVLCTGKVERVGSPDAIFSYQNRVSGAKTDEVCAIAGYTEGIAKFNACMTDQKIGVLSGVDQIDAVGFKTVAAKGYYGVHELTKDVLDAMRAYLTIAPAHNTAYLEAIGCFRKLLPATRFVGVFETAFHQTIPLKRKLYSLPFEWYQTYGIQKLGYHGASHSYCAAVLTDLYGTTGKAVTCHLGGSGSLCAIEDGRSVDTSFGMSLQVGLLQSARTGDMDPYLIRYLEAQGLKEDDIFDAMTKRSGLLGVSGIGRDLRDISRAAREGNRRAQLAADMFVESILHYIGAYAAKMGGLDNLVFTGGIGENSAMIREKVCERLAFLGLTLDPEANNSVCAQRSVDRRGVNVISAADSAVRVLVIPADEEIVVCRSTYKLLTDSSSSL